MDLSDGLALDLHRMCWESKVAAALDREPPISAGATLAQALAGGEDYELLFTSAQKLPLAYQGIALTRIGTIERGTRGRVMLAGKLLQPKGWDPFRNSSAT